MTGTAVHPPGASLHLGGDAWAAPALEPLLVPIDSISGWPGNPRRHDQDDITSSIRDHGLYAGCVVQAGTNRALIGHGRRQALLDLGATLIPATPMDVDDDRAAAIVVRDNATSDRSTNDTAGLLALLAGFGDNAELLALAGYVDDDLADLQRQLDNLAFVESALDGDPDTDSSGDETPAVDIDSTWERVTVTVEAGSKPALYALLTGKTWVRDMADVYNRGRS